jgi:hypothetical protein
VAYFGFEDHLTMD